ncbi:MAG: sigma 54-dependent Fis family transcriptional regulator [Deltaproteobacteria bacterium]|nr:sigma 54-dependent Fis family transcriptional regulator [Deltaproteobacteria bacterium]
MPEKVPSADDLETLHRQKDGFDDKPGSFAVHVTAGPDQGKRFPIEPSAPVRVLLGSGPACEIRLTDRLVSRRHAALEHDGFGLRLTDLRSTNGTMINGVRIVEALLRGGETVCVGGTTLWVERVERDKEPSVPNASRFGRVLGGSLAMRRLYPLCERLATSDVPVLIEGETGTGKELLAESLHEASPRASLPFVVFDCSAISPSLIESHLFGHERGAFTGATSMRRGVFELADRGTLFIDEIGDLDLALQARLLRATERGEVCRVGGEKWIRVDVRIIAATRRDLDREVQAGRFRDDLFFRLAVARIELPPLRQRHGDIGLLARHFWQRLGVTARPIPYELFEKFDDLPWPGNVRELYNAVARRAALGELAQTPEPEPAENLSDPDSPPDPFLQSVLAQELPFPAARQSVLNEFERRYVARVLDKHDGDAGKAAAASGIARRYFNLIRARHK